MSISTDEEYEDFPIYEEVERHGEFGRTNEKLGSGAYKEVYRGIDHDRGIEIAWNQLRLTQNNMKTSKYLSEIQFLETLEHPNIIKFYSSWVDERLGTIIFITEWMSSGTLKQFTKERFPGSQTNLKPVKHWCRQILSGLEYLHSRDPPIIHRDIKCDNIFLDATSGRVKIGDLGLAREFISDIALTVIGTPEFMAPEFYNEFYTEKVDIWAFGMAVIEMVTGETPYYGLNPVQIYRKVSESELPQQLEKIIDPELLAFVNLCLQPESTRPSAAELLDHDFLKVTADNPQMVYNDEAPPYSPQVERVDQASVVVQPAPKEGIPTVIVQPYPPNEVLDIIEELPVVVEETASATVKTNESNYTVIDGSSISVRLIVEVKKTKGPEIIDVHDEVVEFVFDVHENVSELVSEMISELNIPPSVYNDLLTYIMNTIQESNLLPL